MQDSQIYVAIDLETTGLNSSNDEIIDIGAVKFNENGTIDTYSSLIKPNQLISKFITQLTKISNHDVLNAPKIEDVKDEFIDFLENFPIIGHNVSFDVGFLESNGIPITQPLIDTYQLAACILPKDTYSLANLARVFNIDSWDMHRALPDAETTKTLFTKLTEHAMELDPDLILQLKKFSRNSQSPLEMIFEKISLDQSKKNIYGTLGSLGYNRQYLEKRAKSIKSNNQNFTSIINNLLVSKVFSSAGTLSKIIDNFEYRNEQEEIAYSVWECLNENKNLLLEGGTGIGKTLSYLIPSTLFSIGNNSTIVISTNTINLQEQLLQKDIPSMKKVIVESTGIPSESINIINLKGRNNYLCLDKWETQQSFSEISYNQARVFGKINTWLNTTITGDKSEINIERRDGEIWDSLSSENCYECLKRSSFCFLKSLRKKSEESQIVITNHSLLLRDMVQGGGLLPEYKYLIVDEAHHLENEATSQFSNLFSSDKIESLLNAINSERGLINIKSFVKLPSVNSKKYLQELSGTAEKLDQLVSKIRLENQNLFKKTANLFHGNINNNPYDNNNHLLFSEINNESWPSIVKTWKSLDVFLIELMNLVLEYKKSFSALEKLSTNGTKSMVQSSFTDIENSIELVQQIGLHFFLEDNKNTIYWVNQKQDELPTYNSAPLNVGEILRNKLEEKNSVILTSATLAVRENFSAIEKQVGLNDSDKLIIQSPFNYAESVLMCLPTDMPSPTEKNYTKKLSETIGEITKSLKGHTLVLFTSHKSLRDSWKYLTEYLEGSTIQVIAQGINGSPNRIMNSFMDNNESVILGASSFWEGVDFPKESLKAIIVARLPFEPPNDPIFRARSQLFDNPFLEYALPNAVLRFRQGFGRLIRRATDKGAFITLDNRISTKRYGRYFIQALPEIERKNASTNQIPSIIADWLHKNE